ncbi:MAG: type II toxin-antitoxin system PemK/MazF family toxin [Ornithinimicrobium sp.]
MSNLPTRSEVWWCEMAKIGRRPVVARSSPGRRPVVVFSRDAVIPRHRRALVAPCTTTVRGLVSEVVLEPDDDPVPLRSAANLDSIESVSVAVLVQRIGRLADSRMRGVCAALAIAVDCA